MYGEGDELVREPQGSDDEDVPEVPLKWRKGTDAPLPEEIDTLVVAENDSAVDFARRCLAPDPGEPTDRIDGADVRVYEAAGSRISVVTSSCREPERFGEIVLLLRPRLQRAKRIVAVQTLARARYQTDDARTDEDVVRCLSTDPALDGETPRLQVPNFITGVTAGAINFCDFNRRPAIAYVSYSEGDAFGLDEDAAAHLARRLGRFDVPLRRNFTRKTVTATTYL